MLKFTYLGLTDLGSIIGYNFIHILDNSMRKNGGER